MIPENISSHIIVAGIDYHGKGGVSTVISCQKDMMETFNFLKLQQPGWRKYVLPFVAVLKAFRYLPTRYKIVHIHSASYSDFYRSGIFVLLFKLFRKKVILHIHGAEFEKFHAHNPRSVNYICHKADMLVTVSNYFVNFLKRVNLNDNVALLHNSIPTIIAKTNNNCTHPDTLILSYFGVITGRKGIFEVLEAIAICKNRLHTNIEFHIGGNGEIDRMHDTISRLGLQDTVIYDGWLGENEKKQLLEKSDIFIHPSYFESFGISILEAIGHGIPVITTAVGGITDLVTDRFNGIVVEPGNVEQIAEAIIYLANHPEERLRLGANASKHAANFCHEKIAEKLQDRYNTLL